MCEPENIAKRDVLQRRPAENLAKRAVWRTCAAENIAFRDESARARAQPAQLAAQTRPAPALPQIREAFVKPAARTEPAQVAAQPQPALQQQRSRKAPQAAEHIQDPAGDSSKPRETRVFGKTARRKHRETRRLAYVRGRKHRETRCFATAPRRKPRKTRRLANLRCRKHRVSRRICARARARALSPRSWPRRPGQPCSGSLHAGRRGPPGAPRAQPATAGNPAKRACLTRRAAESIAKRDVW